MKERNLSADLSITQALFAAQDGKCFYCSVEFTGRIGRRTKRSTGWTRDHLRPRSAGNTNAMNIVLACQGCNDDKKSRQPSSDEVARALIVWRTAHRFIVSFNGCSAPEWGEMYGARQAAQLIGF